MLVEVMVKDMNIEWYYKRIYWKVRKYLDVHAKMHIKKKKYYNLPIHTIEETGAELEKMILSGKPFAAGRIGGSELRAMVQCQPEANDPKQKEQEHGYLVCLSGFFGEVTELDNFSRLMESSLGDMDLIGVWYNQMEDYMIHHYAAKDVTLGRLEGLEPWYNPEKPWTRLLAGKKVLCIHPFKESILTQYEKQSQLFPGTEILPAFELRCVKAVQTLMNQKDDRFETWFDALDYMYEEAMKEDFDLALIACGAYGLPLAAKLKRAGKQAVHMGGALQLLFGVKGKRWDDSAQLKPYYSDAWIYPLDADQLTNGDSVENGCYWK